MSCSLAFSERGKAGLNVYRFLMVSSVPSLLGTPNWQFSAAGDGCCLHLESDCRKTGEGILMIPMIGQKLFLIQEPPQKENCNLKGVHNLTKWPML